MLLVWLKLALVNQLLISQLLLLLTGSLRTSHSLLTKVRIFEIFEIFKIFEIFEIFEICKIVL